MVSGLHPSPTKRKRSSSNHVFSDAKSVFVGFLRALFTSIPAVLLGFGVLQWHSLIHAGSKKLSLTYTEIENLRVESKHHVTLHECQKHVFSREDQCGSFQRGILVIDLDELSIIFHSSNLESNKLDICAQNSWTTRFLFKTTSSEDVVSHLPFKMFRNQTPLTGPPQRNHPISKQEIHVTFNVYGCACAPNGGHFKILSYSQMDLPTVSDLEIIWIFEVWSKFTGWP